MKKSELAIDEGQKTAAGIELCSYRPFSYLSSSSQQLDLPAKLLHLPAMCTTTINTDSDFALSDTTCSVFGLPSSYIASSDGSPSKTSFPPSTENDINNVTTCTSSSQTSNLCLTNDQNNHPSLSSSLNVHNQLVDSRMSNIQQGSNNAGKKGEEKGKLVKVKVDVDTQARMNGKKVKRIGSWSEEEKRRNVAIVLSIFIIVFFNPPFGILGLIISCCSNPIRLNM